MFLASLILGFTGVFFPWMIIHFLIKPEYFPLSKRGQQACSRLKIFIFSLIFTFLSVLFIGYLGSSASNNSASVGAVFLGMVLAGLYWFILVGVRKGKTVLQVIGIEPKNKMKVFAFDQLAKSNIPAPAPAPVRIPCEYWMMYRDVDGNETARDFDLIKVYERHNRWYFDAHCDLVRDERTFRVDRVELLKNNDTGKMWSLEKDIRKHFRELSRNGGF